VTETLTKTPSRTFLGRGLALKLWGFSSFSWRFFVVCLSWSLFSISNSKPSGTVGSFTAGFFSVSALSSIFLLSSRGFILNLWLTPVSVWPPRILIYKVKVLTYGVVPPPQLPVLCCSWAELVGFSDASSGEGSEAVWASGGYPSLEMVLRQQ